MRGESVQGGATRESGVPGKLSGRIPELDGLRGIAIGMVWFGHYFLMHGGTPPGTFFAYVLVTFRLHWSGVDLFFVLSGFLIGGILLDARESTNYFRVFYIRRFFRILPLYILCLVGTLLLYGLVRAGLGARVAWMLKDPISWYSYPLFLQNFWMAIRTNLGVYPLGMTWSLAVEEQFYLTLPLLIRFLSRRALVTVLSAGIVLAPLLRMALYFVWPDHFLSWFMLMPCRADALLLGVLGAIALRDDRCRAWLASKQSFFHFLLFPVLLLGLAFFILKGYNQFMFPMLSYGFSWISVFYLSVLLYALLWPATWMAACLRWRWLGWLGIIAYGAYMFHDNVIAFVMSLFWSWSRFPIATIPAHWVAVFASIPITLLLCRLSWIYFEKPMIRIGHGSKYKFADASAEKVPPVSPELVRP
jgi:peptidoglycan/LPS O-acetylase OafA/YrhL